MHAVKDGAADRSYGLHVAALAGVPPHVISQAQNRLLELEQADTGRPAMQTQKPQLGLFDMHNEHPLIEAMEGIDPDTMTPQQAQQVLYTLKDLSRQKLNG
jgi:DNA mismatch repair protein MutS